MNKFIQISSYTHSRVTCSYPILHSHTVTVKPVLTEYYKPFMNLYKDTFLLNEDESFVFSRFFSKLR